MKWQDVANNFFFSTPAKEFLFETHTNYPFVHWLPKPIFNLFLTKTGKSWASKDYMSLLTKKSIERLMQKAAVKSYQILNDKISFLPFQHIVYGKS